MLKEWFNQQQSSYWLITSKLFGAAIEANQKLPFPDPKVLFQGRRFDSVMSMTPVLLPVGPEVLSLPDEILNQGIGIAIQASDKALLVHLQSLLFAALDGEEMLFRFYDLEVLAPMLSTLDEQEQSSLCGNIAEIALVESGSSLMKTYINKPDSHYKYQAAPWWRIKPHHLAPLYKTEHHARALSRRWWEYIPYVMAQIDHPELFLTEQLRAGLQQGNFDTEQAELYALAKASKASGIPTESIRASLRLSKQDLQTINKYLEITIG